MKKKGTVLPCRTSPLHPIAPRATSNSLCVTNKKRNNFASTQTIQVRNTRVAIPCFLLTRVKEFIDLSEQFGYIEAIKILADKYNVNIKPSLQHIKRYIYTNANAGIMPPVIQYSKAFQLDELASVSVSDIPAVDNDWSIMLNDARYVSVCNDDTNTFSQTFTSIIETYWGSILPTFEDQYYSVINSINKNTNIQSGCLLLANDRIIFVPIIYNELFLFYNAYAEGTNFNLLYNGQLSMVKTKLNNAYGVIKGKCEIKKQYPRWV